MVKEVYETDKLRLLLSAPALAPLIVDYYRQNKEFLQLFDPIRDNAFFTEEHQIALAEADCKQASSNTGYRYWIMTKEESNQIIGSVALSSIVWGSFLSCFMGYKLDKNHLNRGYMTQAVQKCVEIGFRGIGLHRIEANIMPRNKASLRVVEKAGFVNEGLSKKYLKINGVWEDHIHMVILNREME